MINLENTLKGFVNTINYLYEKIYEDMPSFPKFSIWRMMTKIWYKTVYQKLEAPLAACFKKLLKVHRQKQMSNMINLNKIILNKKSKKNDLDDVPLPLYMSYKTLQ